MPTQHRIKIQDQIVIYDNRVNIGLSGLKKTDRDIFMACAYKLKSKKNVTIELGYTELMKLAQFKHMTLDEFHEYLKHDESVSDVKLTYEDPYGNIAKAPLFKLFLFDREKRAIRLKVNEEFINVFSVLTKNFTELDLVIYTSLKSKYSKVGGADIFLDFLQGLRKEQCQCTRRSRKRQPLSYTISLDRLLLLFEKWVTLPVKLCIYG